MLTHEETKEMDDCVVGLIETLQKNKVYIGMASMSLLLVTYAQDCNESLESFLDKMKQCWEVIRHETAIVKEKKESNQATGT